MTEDEKKIKKYVNQIERRLEFPLPVKARINHDLATEIHLRKEQGESVAQIIADMGSPEQIAARFHAEMAEQRLEKKNPTRYLFLFLLLLMGCGFAQLIYGEIFLRSQGVIGGADGPTTVFITSGQAIQAMTLWHKALFFAAGCLGCIAAFLLLSYGKDAASSRYRYSMILAAAGLACWITGLVIAIFKASLTEFFLPGLTALIIWLGLIVTAAVLMAAIWRMRKVK